MNDPAPSPDQTPCRHLRSKEMYYQAVSSADDPDASGVYWCAYTQEPFGPDGQPADKTDCCGGRRCYVG